MEYPERLSRLLIFVKWLLVIPHFIVLYLLGFVAGFVWLIAWFAILFTGNIPQGLFDFLVGLMRWSYRVNVYLWLLTDIYPPFSFGPSPEPPPGYAPRQATAAYSPTPQ
jgi:hypothetical protein